MEVLCPKNYYNEQGILLIAKGSPISSSRLNVLETHYSLTDEKKGALAQHTADVVQNQKQQERFQSMPAKVLSQASDLLIQMIFDSKTKPWSMHLSALSNYIDWIYIHCVDTALISLMMAVKLNYSDQTLYQLGLGALLHDIGKLLIPKRILQKTDTLTDTEKMVLQQHCELGIDSVTDCSLSEISTNIIIQHHERLDGSGYPNGLAAEQISDCAKIVMIADSFDALTAGRPYKKTKSTKEALAILKQQGNGLSQQYLSVLETILA